jgi:hypothetical protein
MNYARKDIAFFRKLAKLIANRVHLKCTSGVFVLEKWKYFGYICGRLRSCCKIKMAYALRHGHFSLRLSTSAKCLTRRLTGIATCNPLQGYLNAKVKKFFFPLKIWLNLFLRCYEKFILSLSLLPPSFLRKFETLFFTSFLTKLPQYQ